MKKRIDLLLIVTTAVCLLPMILGAVLYRQLPDQVPVHFDAAGVPNGYAPRAFACFGLPLILAGLNLFSHFSLHSDPRRAHAAPAVKVFVKCLIPLIALIVVPLTLFAGLGRTLPLPLILSVLVGVILIVAGNYLPKSRQNYTVGIKLPWTLHSEDNWNRTHRLAGILWVICGLLFILSGLFQLHAAITLPVLLGLAVIVPFVYSYLLYRKGI